MIGERRNQRAEVAKLVAAVAAELKEPVYGG